MKLAGSGRLYSSVTLFMLRGTYLLFLFLELIGSLPVRRNFCDATFCLFD